MAWGGPEDMQGGGTKKSENIKEGTLILTISKGGGVIILEKP